MLPTVQLFVELKVPKGCQKKVPKNNTQHVKYAACKGPCKIQFETLMFKDEMP
jgi:hypothetical protein